MAAVQNLYPLKGVVQDYSWGGYRFIPELLGAAIQEGKPQAEYWLGAHPKAPSFVNGHTKLDALIAEHPVEVLGPEVVSRFGRLPYLLKVLDVRQMLSIQVHPDKQSAEIGFAEENRKGVPLNASHRNYRDDNHKPELMVALSDFWLLHGFRTEEELNAVLAGIPEFAPLQEIYREGYRALYQYIMNCPQEEVNRLLQPLMLRILPLYRDGRLPKEDPHFWAARAAETFCSGGNYDRGIFSVYFFNLLNLRPGEGIYQQAGLPHAYLEGQNVEIMANSDNVLRAGLTDKHIDVPELIRHVRFEATIPKIITAQDGRPSDFITPAREFALEGGQLPEGTDRTYTARSAEILLVLEGSLLLRSGYQELRLGKGTSALVTAGTQVHLICEKDTTFFRAYTPYL